MQGQKSVLVYLPGKESWYDLRNGSPYKGTASHKLQVLEESIPSFQRGGTIAPRKDRFRCSSTQMVNDPIHPGMLNIPYFVKMISLQGTCCYVISFHVLVSSVSLFFPLDMHKFIKYQPCA
jgi:hypothetical protein